MLKDLFKIRKLGWLTPARQIILLVLTYSVLIATVYWARETASDFFGRVGSFQVIFAPLYEEIIFRGLILGGLLALYNKKVAIFLSSILFGLWHLKNFQILSTQALIYQVLYTGLLLGPLLAWVALRFKSIWPGVLIHVLNNILSILSWWIIASLLIQT